MERGVGEDRRRAAAKAHFSVADALLPPLVGRLQVLVDFRVLWPRRHILGIGGLENAAGHAVAKERKRDGPEALSVVAAGMTALALRADPSEVDGTVANSVVGVADEVFGAVHPERRDDEFLDAKNDFDAAGLAV